MVRRNPQRRHVRAARNSPVIRSRKPRAFGPCVYVAQPALSGSCHGKDKLIGWLRERIFDAATGPRAGSPTYDAGLPRSADNGHELFVPAGFAHGFPTLEPGREVAYGCSALYAPAHDGGIVWNGVGIDWPLPHGTMPELSGKDDRLPTLAEFDSPFLYDGQPLQPLA